MYATITQQRVKDFGTWKKEFDGMKDLRSSNGAYAGQIYRDENDPNKVIIILRWNSLANAKRYFNSPELKAELSRGGAEGTTVSFLNEI